MELKEFIKNTITSISAAIIESQEELKDDGVIVNPEKVEIGKTGEKLLRHDGWRYIQNLEFDIMIAVEEKKETGGKGELKIAGVISAGGGLVDENLNKNASRLKFSIPVAFNTTDTPEKYSPRNRK